MAIDIKSPDDILKQCLVIVGFPEGHQESVRRAKNLERFSSHFGSQPIVYAVMYEDLQPLADEDGNTILDVERDKTTVNNFLMAIYFLKIEPTENQS